MKEEIETLINTLEVAIEVQADKEREYASNGHYNLAIKNQTSVSVLKIIVKQLKEVINNEQNI